MIEDSNNLNSELKTQIEAFVIEKLENCELFVNTYGKDFVAKRLALNFKELYVEDSNKRRSGEYRVGTSGILKLFMNKETGKPFSFEDLKKQNGLPTALHECVHAIFNRVPEECNAFNISCGTGIYEKINNQELGRGLNEGFTNWVCNKAGVHTSSYSILTSFVDILEVAIGPEKVMEFGKGDVRNRIPQLLGMDLNSCITFLGKIDQLNIYDDKYSDFFNIAYIIKRKCKFEEGKENSPELTMPHDLEKAIQELETNPLYADLLYDDNYLEYASQNNLTPDSEEAKLQYCEYQKEYFLNKTKELKQEIYVDIIDKYFIQELETIIDKGECSIEEYSKFSKLFNLMYITDDNSNERLKDFKSAFDVLKKSFFDKAKRDIKTSVENGTITAEQLKQYQSIISKWSDDVNITSMIAEIMLPENTFAYRNLFSSLGTNDKMSEIFDYRLFELYNQKGKQTNLFYNTKNNRHFVRFIDDPVTMCAGDEIEDEDSLFNITLIGLQSIQEIVKNFLTLKDKICQENPNTCLQIVEGVVISTIDGGEPTFYVLDENQWSEAKVTEFIPQNVQKAKSLQNDYVEGPNISEIKNDSLAVIEKNPFKRFFQKIKNKFFKPEKNFVLADTQTFNPIEEVQEDENDFYYNLRHTEDGKPIQTPRINQDKLIGNKDARGNENRSLDD